MKKVLVLGGLSMVGSRFIELNLDNFFFYTPFPEEVDILKADQIKNYIDKNQPDLVINFAAYTNVPGAEKEKGDKDGLVYKLNAKAAQDIAKICKANGTPLIHISTEYIFDGTKSDAPYQENDRSNPINWYGATKFYGESFVQETGGKALIMRISMPFRSQFEDKKDFLRGVLGLLQQGKTITAITDSQITPIFIDDFSQALKTLIENREVGIFNIVSISSITPFALFTKLAKKFEIDPKLIKPIDFESYNQGKEASLLKYSWLSSQKFTDKYKGVLNTVEKSLDEFTQQVKSGTSHS